MTTTIQSKLLTFVRQPGDEKSTQRVILDEDGPPYSITAVYRPVLQGWTFDVSTYTTQGLTKVISSFLANSGEDLFANVVAEGRPRGSLFVYNRLGSADPTAVDSWSEGIELQYLPPGALDEYTNARAKGVVV